LGTQTPSSEFGRWKPEGGINEIPSPAKFLLQTLSDLPQYFEQQKLFFRFFPYRREYGHQLICFGYQTIHQLMFDPVTLANDFQPV
jgi:hypothetical protein